MIDLPRLSPRTARRWLADGTGSRHRRVQSTLMFADISGYTRMCERLASRGRAGSEEAVQLISSVMEELIARVEEREGDILVFAGDAVVALFAGPDSARAAVDSASGIRDWFCAQQSSVTSAGRVALRVAIGLATGPVDLVLAGGEDVGLFVAGPTATTMVELEREATAGEVLLCRLTADRLSSAVRLTERNGAFLLPRRHAPSPASATTRDAPEDRRLVPRTLRPLLDSTAGWTEGQHRLATMAFLVTGGLDHRLANEAARVSDDLDTLFRVVADAAAQQEVTLLSTDVTADGVALFLGAGAPHSHGNDEERMLRVLRQVMDAPIAARVQLRAGTNRGPVFAGLVGAPHRAAYSAMGDTTNLAARLAFRAVPGELLATAGVLTRSELEFDVEAAPEFHPKGKAEAVTPYRVGRALGRRERTPDHLPLVGRDGPLALLTTRLDAALAGVGSVVSVTGVHGVGKTRLATELLADERIAARLLVRFSSSEEGTPYAGLQQALRELCGLFELDAGEHTMAAARFTEWAADRLPGAAGWLPLLAVPFGLTLPGTPQTDSLDERFRRQRLHDLVDELLVALLGPGSVIVLEDFHWADEASRALLTQVLSRPRDRGWLVLALAHGSGAALDADNVTEVALTPLDDAAVVALAISAAGETPLSDADLRAVQTRGCGNPLFVRELVAALVDHQDPAGELPEELETLLVARIDRLAPRDRALLSRAAVLGRSIDLDLLPAVLDDDAAQDLTRWAPLDEFVEWLGPRKIRYRHDLLALAAYNGLPVRTRRLLHARVARHLEEHAEDVGAVAAQLARHHERAGAAEPAYRYGRLAGDQARARFANVDATAFYRRALVEGQRAGVPAPDLAGLAEVLGDVAEMAGSYDEAMRGYAVARSLLRSWGAEGLSRLARVERKSGIVCERTGRYRQALAWYSRSQRTLPEHAETAPRRIRLLLDRAGVRQRQGRPRDTVTLCLDAAAAAREAGERAMEAHAYYLLHAAYGDLGSPEAEIYRDRALPIYEELGDLTGQANVLNNLGVDAYYAGRWREAVDLYRRSHDARERIGDVTSAATESNNEAEVLSDQGHLDQARALFDNSLRVWRAAGYEIGIALVTSNLGRLHSRAGEHDAGLALLDDALGRFTALGSRYFVDDTSARMAEAHLLAGDTASAHPMAAAVLARVLGDADSPLVPGLQRTLGWCALLAGDAGEASDRFEAGLLAARAADARFETASTLHAMLSLPGLGPDRRADCAREAAALLTELGVMALPEPCGSLDPAV